METFSGKLDTLMFTDMFKKLDKHDFSRESNLLTYHMIKSWTMKGHAKCPLSLLTCSY